MENNSDEIQIQPTSHVSNEEMMQFNGLDIAFVIDTTSSMGPYIQEAKSSIIDIVETSEEPIKEAFPLDYKERIKFGIVAYRDHPPQDSSYVTNIMNFTNSSETLNAIKLLVPSGGGDHPEAAMDGMFDAVHKLNWRNDSDKMLFLILDAPPHGIRFGTSYDCPCKITEEKFLPTMAQKKIKFFVIKKPNENGINKMVEVFKKYIDVDVKDFEGNNELFSGLFVPSTSTCPFPEPSVGGLFGCYAPESSAPKSNLFCGSAPTNLLLPNTGLFGSYSNINNVDSSSMFLNSTPPSSTLFGSSAPVYHNNNNIPPTSSLFGSEPSYSNVNTNLNSGFPTSSSTLNPPSMNQKSNLAKSEMNNYIVSNCMSNINNQILYSKKN